MKKTVIMIIGLVLVLAARVYAYDDGDFQVWNTDTQEFKISKDTKVALEEEFRWGNNATEFYYHHYDLGFFYNLRKYANIGAGYRQVYELKSAKFKEENEPYVTLTLFWDLSGFKFDDRNRVEYRHFDYQADSWRYRNKISVKLPWKFTKFQIQPYISDELLFGFGSANQINQNRFSPGFSMNLAKNIKGEIYYMLQSTRSYGIWKDANILGAKLKITF